VIDDADNVNGDDDDDLNNNKGDKGIKSDAKF
jgi:hypothetical protein